MLKLYGSTTSPFVRHCRIAMMQENIDFELVLTDYATSASQSPAGKVPYLKGDHLFLTDSSAIIHYARTSVGKLFFVTSGEANLYFLANTALDAAINLFLMEKDGITDTAYLDRQRGRISACFLALDDHAREWNGEMDDAVIRLGCLLTWVQYRDRYDFSHLPDLVRMDEQLSANKFFQETAPPPQ